MVSSVIIMRTNQVFHVAAAAGDGRLDHAEHPPPFSPEKITYALDRTQSVSFVAHHAALPDRISPASN